MPLVENFSTQRYVWLPVYPRLSARRPRTQVLPARLPPNPLASIKTTAARHQKGHGVISDLFKNYGLLTVAATTTLTNEIGLAQTYSIGIAGNQGRDYIINKGQISVTSGALAKLEDVSFTLVDNQDADSETWAAAIGIDGGDGGDYIFNTGVLGVTAKANTDVRNVEISALELSADGANTTAEAVALGIQGGESHDRIGNSGTTNVTAKADSKVAKLDVSVLDLSFIPPLFGFDSEQVATTASAKAVGIASADGDDSIKNSGSLLVKAEATVDVDGLDISALGLGSDINRNATTNAAGIAGGKGNDVVKNDGVIDVQSTARLNLLDISAALLGGATDIDASNEAVAKAVGIDGGHGHDRIVNQGQTTVNADASINSVGVGISLLSALQGSDIRAPLHVESDAIGIAGGEGYDSIINTDKLTVKSKAGVDAWDVEFSAVDLSSGGMSTSSQANAVAIDGGKGSSRIHNSGEVSSEANATTSTKNLTFTLVDLSIVSDIVDLIFQTPADSSTTAKADSSGIRTGDEHDRVVNDGSLSVSANANTNTFDFSMSLDGVSNFTDLTDFPDFFLQAPMVDASTTADASVVGIDSGRGHDNIVNLGTLTAKANAKVTASSVGVDLPLPELLPQILPNIDTTEVASAAEADAIGITTGDGRDSVKNSGNVWSEANATAHSLSVNATIGAAFIPDPIDFNIPYSIEANLVDVGAQTKAKAAGIETGKGDDYLTTTGDITARAAAVSSATNIAATLAYEDDKVSIGLSLANASTEGEATATAIDSGDGDDWLHSSGVVLADSSTTTTSTAVTAKIQLTKDTLLGIGASATRANTVSKSDSFGILLGDGNDDAHNAGSLTAKAHNNSNAIGVDVGITIPVGDEFGIVGEGNWVSTDTLATSSAAGMLGGAGRDYISNSGTVVADALARPNSVSVAANASGTKKGASIGIALTQAKTDGSAVANGISGGEDEDWLVNTGTVNSKAKTDTVAASVSASLMLTDKGVALTGTAADGATNATSTASGISGDEAEDFVDNKGTVDVFADANAVSGSVSVSAQGANKGVALGLALSRATSGATADSQGISGGLEDDDLNSSGLVKSHAKALVIGGSLAIAGGGTSKGLTVEGAAADGSTTGKVVASGISGDEGNDYIINKGDVDVLADADATSVSVGVTANGTGTGGTIGIALGRATSKAEADSLGISGGSGHDSIASSGSVKSHALSTVISGSAALAAGGSSKGVTVEGAGVDAATDAISTAKGITGDEGYVEIVNKGDLDVLADADAVSASAAVTASGTGTGINFGLGLARATSIAEADSTGISGGIYGDLLYSEGSVKSHAKSLVVAGSAALAAGGTGKGLDIKGAGADGTTRGKSTAVGFKGENGDDYIESKGAIDVLADADATSASVSIAASGTGTGLAVGIAVARARSEAEADGTGIEGGQGNDHIHSSGTLKSHAKSLVIAGSGALAGGGAGKGVSAQGVGVDAQTSGLSNAQGISGGEGRDYILVEEAVDVFSDTSTTSIGVAVTANGTGTGLTFGLGLARAGADGEAISHGVSGGEDDDILLSNEPIKSHAKSLVIAGSGGLAAGGTGKGVTITGAAVDAASNGQSTARGVSGDNGKDIIVNHDMVDVLADTDTTSVGLAVTANGTGAGVSLGIGLARATTIANADSSGISGGEDDDQILNNGLVKSHATSDVIAGSAALAGTFAGKGVALSGAAADASTLGNARASGISGDLGVDEIFNKGDLDVLADSAATSVSVGASASFTAAGVGLGVSLARTDTKADATSTGISLGGEADVPEEMPEPEWKKYKYMKAGMKRCRGKYGHRKYSSRWKRHKHCGGYEPEPMERTQTVVNNGKITSKAIADADSVSVSVQVGFTGAGVQAGAALADASTRATAASMGIEGSGYKDTIVNQNSVDSIAGADATTTSVGVNFNAGVKALTLSVALTDATANANASSIGIAGLGGDDIVGNSGGITAKSTADTNAVAVSVPLSLSIVPLSAAFANADAMASADANAINGGAGNDYLESSGVLLADANSNADGISVSVAPIGVALVGANITAEADAVGIEGASGDDVIFQKETASLTANSSVTATGTTIAATVLGVAGGFDNKSTAISRSTGISGGAGVNKTVNLGSISTDASSEATGTSVSAALTGVTIANTTTIATTHSSGISGGEDKDLILNRGNILILGSSKTIGTSVGASVDPVSFADTTNTSTTHSTGIGGGGGDDDIINLGSIDVGVDVDDISKATGTSVSVALRYVAFADASTSATYHSTGISGDAGLDNILNLGNIRARANSTAIGTSVSAGVLAGTFADSNTNATSYSTGISAGAGLDKILNLGSIRSEANSAAKGTTVSATLAGASFADLSSIAESNAIGIATGTGEDKLLNKASIDAIANATANGTSVAAGLAGFFDGDASTTVTANAMGIDLGSGDDEAFSEGAINIAANSNSKVTSGTGALAGAASAKVNTTSSVVATGIGGGEGNDLIINKGNITIGTGSVTDPWMSSLTSTSFSLAIAGAAIAESTLFAKTESVGVDGGAGDDRISNAGDLNIAATSNNSSTNTSIGIFGAASSEGRSGAITEATGIAGGEGLNEIANTALIGVSAGAFVNLNSTTYTFAGASGGGGTLAAQSIAVGISGGSEADKIENAAAIQVSAASALTASNKTNVTFGGAAGSVTSGSVTTAMGIDSGEGDDYISNRADITVSSLGTGSISSTSFSFIGGSSSTAVMTSASVAKGIDAGIGSDRIHSEGNITATANSSLTADGGTTSTFGSGNIAATVAAEARAAGIETSNGDNHISNINNITVNSLASSKSDNDASAGVFFAGSTTRSSATVKGTGYGIKTDGIKAVVWNEGNVNVTRSGTAQSISASKGDILADFFGINVDARAYATSTANSTEVYGIWGGNGTNIVFNKGSINTTARPHVYARSDADGDGLDGDGIARATATADNVKAFGIWLGNADNYILNEGSISANALPSANTNATTDADEQGDMDPNTTARANNANAMSIWTGNGNNQIINTGSLFASSVANIDKARAHADGHFTIANVDGDSDATASATGINATGIKTGHGDNWLLNQGTITVSARPRAIADAVADGDGTEGDGHADANAFVSGFAYGIHSGNGANWITNDTEGVITSTATAYARAIANADGDGLFGDARAETDAHASAIAYGIRTGNGNNYIVNNGVINVNAAATASTSTTATVDSVAGVDLGSKSTSSNSSSTARAFGIYTGSGDDTILNHGTITTSVSATGGTRTLQREAIHSGAGNDMVTLTEGSVVNGDVDLGADNDTLTLIGSPTINGSIRGSEGTNTMVFSGKGEFEFTNPASDIHTATKTGEGTYTLSALAPMQTININNGVLEINNDYDLQAASSISPSVSSGVDQGSLVINGALDISNGKIDIVIGTGHHIDGDRQSVLTASEGIINSLSVNNIKLPEPSPLLSFYDEMTADALNIQSSVKPFKTVANSSNEEAIANYLDDLLPEAEGDVSVALGEIQVMQAGEHAGAFSSLNPESYISSQQALEFGVKNHMSTLRQRARGLRNGKFYNDFSQPGFVSVEASGESIYKVADGLGLVQSNYRPYGSWTKNHLQGGQLDQTSANSGFEFDSSGYSFGFDQRLDDHRIVGFSVANNTTSLTTDGSSSDIESQLASIYTTYTGDTGFLEGIISSGYNTFDSGRNVTIGSISTSASSEHSGSIFAASIGGGLFIPVTSWDIEAYSTLHYQRLEENGFKEEGAGGIGLDVKSRDSNLLSSEFGFRFARLFANRERKLFTEFGIAWLHELEDDRSIKVSFVDTPESTFSVDAQDIDDDGISFNAGLKYTGRKGVVGSAEFRTELREDYSDQILSTSIQYQFD